MRASDNPSNPVSQDTDGNLDIAAICKAHKASNSVAYHWIIGNDQIIWADGASEVLGCDVTNLGTGRRFASYLDGENVTSRYETVMRGSGRDDGTGVPFEIEYLFRPAGRNTGPAMWIEDAGRWFADEHGAPREVFGTMRLADARHVRDQELNFASNFDPLTGMMNRVKMGEALGEAIAVSTTQRAACAFAIVAVNNLDVMNQAYGYEVADEVIVALGQRLRSVMRVGDAIARYSGGKFGLILNDCKPAELTVALERFLRAVRDSVIETRHGPVWALLSIGAISLPQMGKDTATAIAHAEEALSEAFRMPTDGYVVYNTSEVCKERRNLNARSATEIVRCLRDGLFKLAFQPVFDAQTGQVAFHEALLRMPDAAGQMITAGHLVPIAEHLGLIRLIDRAVLQLALSTLESYPESRLSVNVSATTASDPRWNNQLLDMLAARPELAARLIVEVTETTALDDLPTSHHFVTRLRECGCGVALDDFGAGFTSYRNLKELPITMIKLDGSFCRGVHDSKSDNAIFVKSMADLARAFDLEVVAEWVETSEDALALKAMGVTYLQGHFYGAASTVAPWLACDPLTAPTAMPVPEAVAIQAEELAEEVRALEALDRHPRTREDGFVHAGYRPPAAPIAAAKSSREQDTIPAIFSGDAPPVLVMPLAAKETLEAVATYVAPEPDMVEVAAAPAEVATTQEHDDPSTETFEIDCSLSLLKEALAELTATVTGQDSEPHRLAS